MHAQYWKRSALGLVLGLGPRLKFTLPLSPVSSPCCHVALYSLPYPCPQSSLHAACCPQSSLHAACCIIYVRFATLKLPCTLYHKSWGRDWERGSLIEDTRTLFGSTVDLSVCFYLPPMCAYLVHRRKPLLRPRDFLEKDLFKADWYSYRYKVASFLIWCLVVSFLWTNLSGSLPFCGPGKWLFLFYKASAITCNWY